jgi:hypothetical protein
MLALLILAAVFLAAFAPLLGVERLLRWVFRE